MRRVSIGVSLVLTVIAAVSLYPSPAQVADSATRTVNWAAGNPLKVALLKWYQANTTTHFKVGSQPYGIAFDGTNVWTANYTDASVTKLRTSDGEVEGTFKVGAGPYGV